MPIVKQYLRYSLSGTFNIIASPECNCAWTTVNQQDGRFVATGACESIIIWDVQLGEKAVVLADDKSQVTCLCHSPTKKIIVGGYKDGTVKTYNLVSSEKEATFSGHKKAITCLNFDTLGHRLASGSKDNQIIVWDIVAETGLTRLIGHTAPVTHVEFMTSHNVLVSSSKDTTVKFWDLDTNHCFKTLLGHRTEVWALTFMKGNNFLVTGCGDSELRVWECKFKEAAISFDSEEACDDDALNPLKCTKLGSILRSSTGRVAGFSKDSDENILATYGVNDAVEFFKFVSHLEALRRFRKRKKKEQKNVPTSSNDDNDRPALQDYIKRLPIIKTKTKVKACDIILGKGTELRVSISLANNTLEIYGIDLNAKGAFRLIRKITQQGHHSEVRSLSFSSDNLAIASGSGESVKIWNRASLACVRTVPCGYVLSMVFVPGDRHVLAGLNDGRILIIDVSVGSVLEEISAHTAEVWSICLLPSQKGAASGSGDKTLKLWDFELIQNESKGAGRRILSLSHRKTLTAGEPILFVRISPDSKYVAVALLDMTIKVFFLDTLKFFLSLYGHKLPVVSLDISYDSTLLISGSADRNVKIWGLDFGDCHKSIFAHENSIMSVQFVPNTHYFFTCGKDGTMKQWDADNFNQIIKFKGHHGEAWTLAVSPNGEHVVSSGSDRVIRLYSKTEEPLVLEDEEEEERAREEEELVANEGGETAVKGRGDLHLPSRKTVNSERGADEIIEGLVIIKERLENSDLKTHPLMLAYNVTTNEDFMLEILRRIRASDLEEALVLLPFPAVCDFLEILPTLITKSGDIELVTKTLMFLLKVHQGPIIASQKSLSILSSIQHLIFDRVNSLRDMVGSNLYGLRFIQRRLEEQEQIKLFRDATIERREKIKRKKRKEQALKRAVLTL